MLDHGAELRLRADFTSGLLFVPSLICNVVYMNIAPVILLSQHSASVSTDGIPESF